MAASFRIPYRWYFIISCSISALSKRLNSRWCNMRISKMEKSKTIHKKKSEMLPKNPRSIEESNWKQWMMQYFRYGSLMSPVPCRTGWGPGGGPCSSASSRSYSDLIEVVELCGTFTIDLQGPTSICHWNFSKKGRSSVQKNFFFAAFTIFLYAYQYSYHHHIKDSEWTKTYDYERKNRNIHSFFLLKKPIIVAEKGLTPPPR